MSGSAGQQRVKTWFFEEFKVPNLPLSEQRRIAAVLDTVDAAIRETDAVIAKQEQVKTGLLQDLLTRGLDADGHLRDPARHPEQFQESPLGLIPREWSAERLANVADLQVGFAFKSSWFREDKGIRLLRGTNVGYGCPDWSDTKLLPYSKYEEFKEYELNEGDIIIGMDRPFTKQGFKVSTLYSHDVPSLLVQRVGRFRSGDLDDRYLRGLLRTSIYKRSLLSEQQGMDIPHISKTDILNPVLPIPPRAEQKRIGKILTGHEEKSESESAYRFKLVKLKTGLMQDLLTGRKRVPEIEAQVAEAVA